MGGATQSGGAGWSVADIGDLTGNGYDDVLVGAPTLNGSPAKLGTSSGGTVYLIFGSQYVNSSGAVAVQNWLNVNGATQLAANDRVGGLNQLGAHHSDQSRQRLRDCVPVRGRDVHGDRQRRQFVVRRFGRGNQNVHGFRHHHRRPEMRPMQATTLALPAPVRFS